MTKTTTAKATYHARLELDPSGQWLAELEEIPQVHSFGRTLGKAREYLVDALALWLEEPPERIAGLIEFGPPPLPPRIEEAVRMARAERELAEAATRVATDLTATASIALVDEARLSMRDAADILGLSHQRVQQLVAAGRPTTLKAPLPIGDAVEGFARSVREYLPGGSKEDVGALAAALALAASFAWMQSR